jgi:hypothetical protein
VVRSGVGSNALLGAAVGRSLPLKYMGKGSNIDPTIEIEEGKVRLVARNPGEHTQRDGAIAADHQWDLLGADNLLDPVGQLACDGLSLGESLRVVGGTVNATAHRW